jgi:hypothetical protein
MDVGSSMEGADLVDALAAAVVERLPALLEARATHALVDTATAADVLGVPESWLAARARNGEAPCRRLGKYVRFDLTELRAWIDATTASGPGAGRGPVPRGAESQRPSALTSLGAAGVPFVAPSERA